MGVTVVPFVRNSRWAHDEALRVQPMPCEAEYRSVGKLERAERERKRITALIAQRLVAAV